MSNGYVEAWISGEDFAEAAEYTGLRAVVAPQYRALPIEHLESTLSARLATMTPEQAEDFLSVLGGLGKSIAPIAAQVLPVAAPLIGTAFGGPIGGMLGGLAGQYAGQALAGAAGGRPAQPRPPAPARPAAPAYPQPALGMPLAAPSPPPPPAVPGGASPPTAMQLLSFLQNPQLLQSILGQVMGPAGAGAVPVGAAGTPAPFGSFMNALSVLANQAASEAESAEDQEALPEYLVDSRGRPRCDPAVPEERAALLLQELRETPRFTSPAASDPGSWLALSLRG
jgi:hypothetical protein